MRVRIILFLYLVSLPFFQAKGQDKPTVSGFRLPAVPDSIASPADRAGYIAIHYWDGVDLTSSRLLRNPDLASEAWTDYLSILGLAPEEAAKESLRMAFSKIMRRRKSLGLFFGLSREYLYGNSSPLYNESLYLCALESILTGATLSRREREYYLSLKKVAARNRPGTPASDFSFRLSDGSLSSLYSIAEPPTILLFYYPDCHRCDAVIRMLRHSPSLDRLLSLGRARVLCVYPDTDLLLWKSSFHKIPSGWDNACDESGSILSEGLYSLGCIPALYLIGIDRTVLLKNTSYFELESYLETYF